MLFDPIPGQALTFEDTTYQIAEHPAAPGIAYGQEGRAAIVYKLNAAKSPLALKVFKPQYRSPALTAQAGKFAPFAALPGLTVCRRTVLTPQRHGPLLRQFPDLTYAVLMSWVEGPTWMQVLQEKTALSPEQSLAIAQAFARILAELEQQGIAHCDLSGANLILPALTPDSNSASSHPPIELVDVEQIYAASLERPEEIPSGSDGYAHQTVRQERIWNAKADRFAGAVLLAEMLGWCDPTVRETAYGENFFDPQEMMRPGRRFDLLNQSLSARWGSGVANLFERAWASETLAHCPTFGEWLVALPEVVPQPATKETAPGETGDDPAVAPACEEDPVTATIMVLAERLAAQENLSGALEAYRHALNLLPAGSSLAGPIQEKVHQLEASIASPLLEGIGKEETAEAGAGEPDPIPGPETATRICPYCENRIGVDVGKCPACGKTLIGQTEADPVKSLEEIDFGKLETVKPEPEPLGYNYKSCPNCHRVYLSTATKCVYCEVELSDQAGQETNTRTLNATRRMLFYLLVVFLAFMIIRAFLLN